MSQLKIKSDELRGYAIDMRNKINSMRESLNHASLDMDRTVNAFEGNAADTFRNQYNSLKPRFDDFYSAMENYAIFLDKVADEYDITNKDIQKKAEEVLNSGYDA